MGYSVAKPEMYYIYVLAIEGGGFYIGSTKSFERRMRGHFGKGGSIATRERRAIAIHQVLRLMDYQIRTDCAHERAEVIVAHLYAQKYGVENVRGAKHGKGWGDKPSSGNLRDIGRYAKFAETDEGINLLKELIPVDPMILLPCRLNGALSRLVPNSLEKSNSWPMDLAQPSWVSAESRSADHRIASDLTG